MEALIRQGQGPISADFPASLIDNDLETEASVVRNAYQANFVKRNIRGHSSLEYGSDMSGNEQESESVASGEASSSLGVNTGNINDLLKKVNRRSNNEDDESDQSSDNKSGGVDAYSYSQSDGQSSNLSSSTEKSSSGTESSDNSTENGSDSLNSLENILGNQKTQKKKKMKKQKNGDDDSNSDTETTETTVSDEDASSSSNDQDNNDGIVQSNQIGGNIGIGASGGKTKYDYFYYEKDGDGDEYNVGVSGQDNEMYGGLNSGQLNSLGQQEEIKNSTLIGDGDGEDTNENAGMVGSIGGVRFDAEQGIEVQDRSSSNEQQDRENMQEYSYEGDSVDGQEKFDNQVAQADANVF
ncbi:MAG: hypothetical protein EZS28_038740 [Streblomastix strix]|uniref:Uncharacterized protein n=1 Tax=Streblomastix strix TaxID=222440 RepID=A0A5J4U6E6_9EUKA|nr:MAG: hypothetical protein EZS28_038740 [Streblomastix strix]